ncbi:MAG: phasin family protein [Holosporales bacterium]|nr:phasin family protein [Holosporales bacterium]
MDKKVKSAHCVAPAVQADAAKGIGGGGTVEGRSNNKMATDTKEKKGFCTYDPSKMSEAIKNGMETASNINKMSLEMLNSIAKLQTSFVKQMIGGTSGSCKGAFDLNKIQDQFRASADKIKENIDRNISHGKQIAEMITSTGSQIVDLLKTRFSESMDKFKESSAKKN